MPIPNFGDSGGLFFSGDAIPQQPQVVNFNFDDIPHSREVIEEAFEDTPDSEVMQIVSGNAAGLYQFSV